METPTVNINGTSRNELVNDLKTAFRAVGAAIEALKVCMPNGRDYPASTINAAREAHAGRIQALEKVRNDLVAMARAIQTSGAAA